MAEVVEHTDILIMGAGPVGMTLALALKEGPWSITLVDKRPLEAQAGDPRALALSHGARQLLGNLGAWPERAATAIETIHISQRGGFGRTFMDKAEHNLPALGYVLRYKDLAGALQEAVKDQDNLQCLDAVELQDFRMEGQGGALHLNHREQARQLQAKLVVHAEGTPGDDPEVDVADYQQHAIICEVMPDHPHGKRAWERFTPDGPLALLPLEEGFAVVFTVPGAKSPALMALNDQEFLAALSRQFGSRFGFKSVGKRDCFPLALRQRRELVKGREVWIGNAAQTLHPVSGQGFNLGLRDAWQLADTLLAHNGDPGMPEALADYGASRMLDRKGGALFTDKVVRLFSNDVAPLRWARGLGLLALDMVPPARNFVARRMIWGSRALP